MATLFFSVWANADRTLLDTPLQEGTVTVGAGSLTSDAITGSNNEVRVVRLFTDTDCFVAWGSSPTAANDGSSGMPLGAENPEVIGVLAGHKLAVIAR